ncbi:MAG: chemotaxis protein CheW, partial [Caulobacteraceae bacterium]
GVMALRGRAVPVIDQRGRFGVGDAPPGARPRVIVARIGDLTAGFAVDAISAILELPADRLTPTPELTREAARLFDRVAQIEEGGRVILLVNPRELLDRAERDVVAALAAEAL